MCRQPAGSSGGGPGTSAPRQAFEHFSTVSPPQRSDVSVPRPGSACEGRQQEGQSAESRVTDGLLGEGENLLGELQHRLKTSKHLCQVLSLQNESVMGLKEG